MGRASSTRKASPDAVPDAAPPKTSPSSRRAPKSVAPPAASTTAAPPDGPAPASVREWPWTRRWPLTREQARTLAVPALLAGSTIVVALALLLGATAAIAPIVIGYSLLAPGLALVRLARLGEPVLEAVAAVVISVSIAGLLALVQVYTELWQPTLVTWALVGLTALGLAGDPVILPAQARERMATRLAPVRQTLAAARARAGAWLATPSGWAAEPEELALDGGIRARLAGRRTARELRPPVEVAVPSLAARRRRLAATGLPTTAPDHLLEPPRGVGSTTDGFFDGLIERHEKGPQAEPDAGPSRPD